MTTSNYPISFLLLSVHSDLDEEVQGRIQDFFFRREGDKTIKRTHQKLFKLILLLFIGPKKHLEGEWSQTQ
jgi:hypothetical protein